MARQRLGEKKVAKLRAETRLPIVKVMVRGGTHHRRDLCLQDGSITYLFRDGTMEKSDYRWGHPTHWPPDDRTGHQAMYEAELERPEERLMDERDELSAGNLRRLEKLYYGDASYEGAPASHVVPVRKVRIPVHSALSPEPVAELEVPEAGYYQAVFDVGTDGQTRSRFRPVEGPAGTPPFRPFLTPKNRGIVGTALDRLARYLLRSLKSRHSL